MFIIEILPLTRTLHTQPQILSYFYSTDLTIGSLVEIPLGRKKGEGIVLDSHPATNFRQEIKKAAYELKNISHLISVEPVLTPQQIQLALFLGQYYFTSPGIFLKMASPKNPKSQIINPKKITNNKSQILILTPTISQANLFYLSYSSNPSYVLWHSELTEKQQKESRQKIKNGEVKKIIGTRSAVFLPFQNLKKIIIEDAANPSHRSWDMRPHYSAIVAAEKLAEIFSAKLTLKSEVPFISSSRARTDVAIPWNTAVHEQLANNGIASVASLPRNDITTTIIDLRAEMKAGNFSIFSRALQTVIRDVLKRQQPIILFINRRGAANFVLCRDCGYIAKCQHCDVPLAHHLINQQPRLLCHRCGWQTEPPSICPECQGYRIKAVGVGSQKVELEAQKLFSAAKIARLDSDSAPQAKDQQKIIQNYVERKIDILITTQILFSYKTEIAKRPPAVIGLISADTLLHLPDYQSGERTWQTIAMLLSVIASEAKQSRDITAVRGIAHPVCLRQADGGWAAPRHCGARDDNIIFFIQTYNPQNPIIQSAASGDWQKFYNDEIETRKLLNYPPFAQIVKLTFRHRDPKRAREEAKILTVKLNKIISSSIQKDTIRHSERSEKSLAHASSIKISDALPAFIPKQKSKYVWNTIIKLMPKGVISSPAMRDATIPNEFSRPEFLQYRNSLLQYVPSNWEIEIDPIDLL